MNNKEYTKCKKCGCLLAERNIKKGLCDECQENRKTIRNTIIKIIAMVFIGIALITSMAVICFHINKKYPVTYEDCVMQVVDKREETTYRYSGKAIVPITKYYLLFDNGKEFHVSQYIYDKTDIDDCIIVTYTYRNNNIEDMQIKFQN
jgi:flagellar basal body-associated protein FliL